MIPGAAEYTYSALGVKLRAVQKWNPNYSISPVIGSTINTAAPAQSQTTDYVDNIIYENNALKRILVDGGYYESGNYYFYIQDHWGNNRIVTDAAASVVQSTQYYPFGTSFADASGTSTQPYKYNGKELDARNGLNMYDYSVRWKADWYFSTVDSLAEKYYSISPYAYVANNPIKFIDPDGKKYGPPLLQVPFFFGTTNTPISSAISSASSSSAMLSQTGTLTAARSLPRISVELRIPSSFANASNKPFAPIIPNDQANHAKKEENKRNELARKEGLEQTKNHGENMKNNAPDGSGNAKRTIFEAVQTGAISALGAAAVLGASVMKIAMIVTNGDPSKDDYDAFIKKEEKK